MGGGLLRIAVTGGSGRLGTALLAGAARREGMRATAWRRPDYDLDDPTTTERLLARDEPTLIMHTAAWTNVDACARDPDLAMRRNGDAVDHLARTCVSRGVQLLLVSTNEVFDGARTDGQGYTETDVTGPRNAYGSSKLAGEEAARAAFGARVGLWVIRTAWLFGPPEDAFPARIVAAADHLPPGEALPVVADEVGSPTFAPDLASAILDLVARSDGGLFHLVNAGSASRLEWAAAVLARLRPERTVRPISRHEYARASDPPPWGVLDGSRAAALGVVLRDWRAALAAHLASYPPAHLAGHPDGLPGPA